MSLLARAVASVCFAGYSGFAPGTVGTAVALVVYCLLPPLGVTIWILIVATSIVVAVPAAHAQHRPSPCPPAGSGSGLGAATAREVAEAIGE